MESRADLAVVTVTKDDPHGLQRTLDSIAVQRSTRLQVVVVDASRQPTTSSAVRDAVGTTQVTLLTGSDAGPFDGMNRGLKQVAAPITIFLNGGDSFFAPDTALRILDSFLEWNWTWAYGPVELEVDDPVRGRVAVGKRMPSYSHWRQIMGLQGLCHQGVIARTSAIAALGGFCLPVGLSADQRLFAELGKSATPALLPFPVARYDLGGLSSQMTAADFVREARDYRCDRKDFVAGSRLLDSILTRMALVRLRVPIRIRRRRVPRFRHSGF